MERRGRCGRDVLVLLFVGTSPERGRMEQGELGSLAAQLVQSKKSGRLGVRPAAITAANGG